MGVSKKSIIPKLFIRIRLPYAKLSDAVSLMAAKCERVVVYEHNEREDNIHCHLYLDDCTVTTDTLKNYVKRFIKVPKQANANKDEGNKFWSFKAAYDDNCIRYMTKGHYEASFRKGFTQEELDEHKSKWVDAPRSVRQPQMRMFTTKETHKESKLRQSEMINEIIRRMKETDDYTHQNILRLIRQVVIIEQSTIVGRYKVRDYFDTIRAKILTPESWISEMTNFIAI